MNTDAPQYVSVDVLSECSVVRIPFYIHHMNMDAHCYVHVDVLSEFSLT